MHYIARYKPLGSALGAALMLPALVFAPIANAVTANTPTFTEFPPEVIALSEKWAVAPLEAKRRLDREPVIVELQSLAQQTYPHNFAGIWVDHKQDGRVFLAMKGEDPAQVANIVGGQLYDEQVLTVVDVELSYEELLVLQQELISSRGLLATYGMPSYGVGIDVAANRPYVIPLRRPSDEAISRINSMFPRAEVRQAAGSGLEACNSRQDCAPPLRGGIALKRVGSGNSYDCSSAFVADGNGSVGNRYVITAGHCAGANNQWQHNGTTFGTMTAAVDSGHSDFARIRVDNGWNVAAWYYTSQTVGSVQDASNDFVGQGVCMSGVTTGTDCGEILDTNWGPSGSGRTGFIRTDYCAQGGDSGATIFLAGNPTRVAGVHTGDANEPGNSCPDAQDRSYYAHADFVGSALNVTIRTTN